MAAFNGVNPNGTWSLYVVDDLGADVGTITGGWSLNFTTSGACGTPTPSPTGTPTTPTPIPTGTATPPTTPTPTVNTYTYTYPTDSDSYANTSDSYANTSDANANSDSNTTYTYTYTYTYANPCGTDHQPLNSDAGSDRRERWHRRLHHYRKRSEACLLRAIGPSLTGSGIPNALADPVLELHGPGAFVTITNDNW